MKQISFKENKIQTYALNNVTLEYVSNFVNGFNAGELITIAARSGCGKSTIARNILVNFNLQGIKTLLVSSEESEREVSSKIAKLINKDRFNRKLFFLEDESLDLKSIENDIKKSKAKIVVIDYIQQLNGNIRDNTKLLKQLSMKYKCVIFMLSQLNRCAAGRMPDASMLSRSDNILHDSDQVGLVHNSELTNVAGDELLILDVAKNRKGKVGKLGLCFNKDIGDITDMDLGGYKRTGRTYQNMLAEKRYPGAKQLAETISDIVIPSVDIKKPLMILKSGIII